MKTTKAEKWHRNRQKNASPTPIRPAMVRVGRLFLQSFQGIAKADLRRQDDLFAGRVFGPF